MKRKDLLEKVLFKIVIYLFTLNIAFSVLPGGFTGFYGLFGEMTTSFVLENQESVIRSKPNKNIYYKLSIVPFNRKLNKVQYAWLLNVIIVTAICYSLYWINLNNVVTPVTLKIRMNN